MTTHAFLNLRLYHRTLFLGVLLLLAIGGFARGEDAFETSLQKLVTDTADAVGKAGVKKVTVLDFTDIAGGTSAFGKYLAEEISVGLVNANKGFTVVDRANLRSILEEHKLTEQGLVKVENAKKLGEFTGVDGFVIGTTTAVNSGYSVTVKVITTERAEVAGAARGKLPPSPDFDDLSHRDGGPTGSGGTGAPPSPREFRSELFLAKFSKLQVLKDGNILVTLNVSKLDPQKRVALNIAGVPQGAGRGNAADAQPFLIAAPAVLRASTGEEYRLHAVTGYPLLTYNHEKQGPGIGVAAQPSDIVLRFGLAEKGARSVIPATTTFTLDFNLDVSASETPAERYDGKGTVNVHFTDVR